MTQFAEANLAAVLVALAIAFIEQAFSEDITNLIRRTAEANTALVRGDIDGYLGLIERAKDYTLMAPFGGAPTRGFDMSSRAAMAQFFKSGTFDQEVVAAYATGDLVVLVRSNGCVPKSAGYQSRTGRCVSHKSFAVNGSNGGSCIGMRIRSRTASPWSRRLRSLGAEPAHEAQANPRRAKRSVAADAVCSAGSENGRRRVVGRAAKTAALGISEAGSSA